MGKHVTAFIAAFVMTIILGLGMFVIGGNAALNPNGVSLSDSPQVNNISARSAVNQSQIDQLQSLVEQYQQRELQYQQELNSVQGQLNQASQTIEQYQQLFQYLAQRGVIRVDQNGNILVR